MNVVELYETVKLTLNDDVPYREIASCLRRVVKDIIAKCERSIAVSVLTTGQEVGTISTDETIISDDERIIGQDAFVSGANWDSEAYTLELPSSVYKVLDLFLDDVRMSNVSIPEVKASGSSMYLYSIVGRFIYFSFDVFSSSYSIKIRYQKNWDEYDGESEEYDGIPLHGEAMLEQGIYYMLYSRPKYYKEALMYNHRKAYFEAIEMFNQQVLQEDSPYIPAKEYTF